MKPQRLFLIASLISIIAFGFALTPRLVAADPVTNITEKGLTEKFAKLQGEIEILQAENAALKKENQSLRRMLGTKQQQTTVAPSTVQQSPASTPAPQKTAGYWITTSSGVRHNNSCRYYMNSKGRSCGPTEGRACKVCGG